VSKKLIVIGGSNNFLNEVRRIEAKMYLSETVGAAMAHFQFDNDGSLDILQASTRHSGCLMAMNLTNEKGPLSYEASEDRVRPCGGHFVVAGS